MDKSWQNLANTCQRLPKIAQSCPKLLSNLFNCTVYSLINPPRIPDTIHCYQENDILLVFQILICRNNYKSRYLSLEILRCLDSGNVEISITRSLGALRDLNSGWRLSKPLDFVLRAFLVLRPYDPRR